MTIVIKEVSGVYTWLPEEVYDTKGPCPEGFHIPSDTEMSNLYSAGTSMELSRDTWIINYLKMPRACCRGNSNSNVYYDNYGHYWTCTAQPNIRYATCFLFGAQYGPFVTTENRNTGCSIRPFKDTVVQPDSSRTQLFSYSGGNGIRWNSTLGLISIRGFGKDWITISDKNLGATTAYSGGSLEESTCGKFYQWGNNYGFPYDGSVSYTTSTVDASVYGPGNYYLSNSFKGTGQDYWDSSDNKNLRGGVSQGTSTVLTEHKLRPTNE